MSDKASLIYEGGGRSDLSNVSLSNDQIRHHYRLGGGGSEECSSILKIYIDYFNIRLLLSRNSDLSICDLINTHNGQVAHSRLLCWGPLCPVSDLIDNV